MIQRDLVTSGHNPGFYLVRLVVIDPAAGCSATLLELGRVRLSQRGAQAGIVGLVHVQWRMQSLSCICSSFKLVAGTERPALACTKARIFGFVGPEIRRLGETDVREDPKG